MLQACLNGGRSKDDAAAVPITRQEIAADAAAARAAGADEFHIHPRDADGAETLDPVFVEACVAAVRAAAPSAPVGVGSGAWIQPGGRLRHRHIRSWRAPPDYASVNLGEDDAYDVIDILGEIGVGVEAGLWTPADAQRFVASGRAGSCLRVLIETTDEDPIAAERTYRAILEILAEADIALPILLHGEGSAAWSMARLAFVNGHATRIGFEDVLTMPDGSPAPSNSALIAAAIDLRALVQTG